MHGILLEDIAPSRDIEPTHTDLELLRSAEKQGCALVVAHKALVDHASTASGGAPGLSGLWVTVNRPTPHRLDEWAMLTMEYLRSNTGASQEEALTATMCLVSELHKAGDIVCYQPGSQADILNEAVNAYCKSEHHDGGKRHTRAAPARNSY